MRAIKGFILPALVTLLLHLGVVFLLGANWSTTTFKTHEVRQVKSLKATMVALPPKAKNKPQPKPVEKPKPLEKPRPKVEPEAVKKPQPKVKKKEPKLTTKPKQETPVEPEPKPDKEALAKAQAKAAEIRRQQEAQAALMAAAEEEDEFEQAESDAEVAESYVAMLKQVIENNWSRPPSARNGMQAELLIQLVPTGEIVSVNIVQSSGNAAFDRSAENAVKKVGRFAELQGMPGPIFERYFRKLRFRFRPEDLRS